MLQLQRIADINRLFVREKVRIPDSMCAQVMQADKEHPA